MLRLLRRIGRATWWKVRHRRRLALGQGRMAGLVGGVRVGVCVNVDVRNLGTRAHLQRLPACRILTKLRQSYKP